MLRITTTRKYRVTRPFLFYSVFPINNRVRSEHLVSFRCFMRKINISAVMKYIITINIHIGMMSEQIRIRPENTFHWCVLLMENKSRLLDFTGRLSHVLVDRSFRNRYIKTTKRYRNFRTSRLEIEIKLDEWFRANDRPLEPCKDTLPYTRESNAMMCS